MGFAIEVLVLTVSFLYVSASPGPSFSIHTNLSRPRWFRTSLSESQTLMRMIKRNVENFWISKTICLRNLVMRSQGSEAWVRLSSWRWTKLCFSRSFSYCSVALEDFVEWTLQIPEARWLGSEKYRRVSALIIPRQRRLRFFLYQVDE